MCFCIGPTGSGKTLLLRRMQNPEGVNDTSTTVPTVGANIALVKLGKGKREVQIEIKEVGGAMAPLWGTYYRLTRCLLYVVDATDPSHIPAATILLLEALSDARLLNAKVLVILTKCDIATQSQIQEVRALLRLDKLARRVQTVEASANTGQGTDAIRLWLDAVEGRHVRLMRTRPELEDA